MFGWNYNIFFSDRNFADLWRISGLSFGGFVEELWADLWRMFNTHICLDFLNVYVGFLEDLVEDFLYKGFARGISRGNRFDLFGSIF